MKQGLTNKQQQWIEKTLATLSLNEKIGQLVCERGININDNSNLQEYFSQYPVGSIFVGPEVIDTDCDGQSVYNEKISELRSHSRVALLLAGDFECGIAGKESFDKLPDLMTVAATGNPDLASQYGDIIGQGLKNNGIDWTFSPVADLNTNPANPVTNVRSLSDDPEIALTYLRPIVQAIQSCKVAACGKHFPGDGTDCRNQHLVTSIMTLSRQEWSKKHGKVFQTLIDDGLMSIMAGHIAFPDLEAIDPQTSLYTPATASKIILTDLLRQELNFDGVLVTDALCMAGYVTWNDYEERILATFNAGADIFLWPEVKDFFPLMKKALLDGRACPHRLEESVRRVLTMKAKLGIEGTPDISAHNPDESLFKSDTAEQIAVNSLTLLRNRDQVLPVNSDSVSTVLFLYTPDKKYFKHRVKLFQELLKGKGCKVRTLAFEQSETISQDIASYDMVLLVNFGKPKYSDNHVDSYATSPLWKFMANRDIKNRIIISLGNPYFLNYVASAGTYLNAYSDAPACIKAVVDAIWGEIPFCGQSPVRHDFLFERGDGLKLMPAGCYTAKNQNIL